jgi:hypothetical protein
LMISLTHGEIIFFQTSNSHRVPLLQMLHGKLLVDEIRA